MVQQSALAVIASSFARRAAVGDVQLAAAVSTPQQTSQQSLAFSVLNREPEAPGYWRYRNQALIPARTPP